MAVDDLDLVAPSGQITVLVGPSGCGKTTSLRMINRMIEPTSGRIWIDDRDTVQGVGGQAAPRHRLRHPARRAVPAPHRSSTTSPPCRCCSAKTRREAPARAVELIERVGLDPSFANRYPAQLSGGQQQRVGVARALAADPPVMLMDEPFSAVDPVVREQLQDEFLRLQGELGKTIVFVTHDIDEAIKLGDQVAVLRVGGKLAQLATPAELLSRPADAFVAGFVGRDRGYRALGFAAAGSCRCDEEAAVALGRRWPAPRPTADGWVLVVDNDAGRRAGWPPAADTPMRLHGDHARAAQSRRHARHRAGHAARGPGRGAVLAQRPRRRRRRGRPLRRHRRRRRRCSSESRNGPPQHAPRSRAGGGRAATAERPADRAVGPAPARRAMNAVWQYFRDNQSEILALDLDDDVAGRLPLVVGLLVALPIGWLAAGSAGPIRRWSRSPACSTRSRRWCCSWRCPGCSAPRSCDRSTSAVALTLYTVALLVRVVADGLRSVSADTLAAAAAMGYTGRQRLFGVQLPIAVPGDRRRACGWRRCRTSAWCRSPRSSACRSWARCSSTGNNSRHAAPSCSAWSCHRAAGAGLRRVDPARRAAADAVAAGR